MENPFAILVQHLDENNVAHRTVSGYGGIATLMLDERSIAVQCVPIDIPTERLQLFESCNHYESMGWRVMSVFSDEMAAKGTLVASKLMHTLGFNGALPKVYARQCTVREITSDEKNLFLNAHHLQGTDRSSVYLGAFHNGALVAVMTFDNRRQMNAGTKVQAGQPDWTSRYELKRFATDTAMRITGIAGKLLNYFIRNYKPAHIVSFADRRWSVRENNVYERLGFRYCATEKPVYAYVNALQRNVRKHRFNFGKSGISKRFPQLYAASLTEGKMMDMAGYHRVWDAGKIKYTMDINPEGAVMHLAGIIYLITNTINGKVYVGQTSRTLSQRMGEHKKRTVDSNNYLRSSFEKYGFGNFTFETIDRAVSLDELNEKEVYWISHYGSLDSSKGYNLHVGGRNAIPGPETRIKMSLAHTGRIQTPEWIARRIKRGSEHPNFGVPHTEQYKKALSEKTKGENAPWFGKKRDADTVAKMRQTKKDKGISKRVSMVDMDTMETVRTFGSIGEAVEATAVTHSTIVRHCRLGLKEYHSTLTWQYTDGLEADIAAGRDPFASVRQLVSRPKPEPEPKGRPTVAVCRYNRDTDEIIATYPSMNLAAEASGFTRQDIARHCNLQVKRIKDGLTWRFKSELTFQTKIKNE